MNRFRLGESSLMSWIDSTAIGDERSALWLTPAVPAHFRFSDSRLGEVDQGWLRRLNASAAASTGLVVLDADVAPARAGMSGSTLRVPRSGGGRMPEG